jgi:phosphate transport system substrate-binding protein
MNARLVKLAVALGTLALTTSSTTKTNALETQESQKLAQVSSPQTIATTGDVRVDGSSTVYPITQAIAKAFESEQNKKVSVNISDYTASENDEVIADGVSKDPNALGYFGYAYYEEHKDKLKVLAVDNGKGAVLASRETVEKAKYQPLSRPLFIYVNPWGAQNKEVVYKFVNFYVDKAPKVASSVGYVPLPAEVYRIDNVHLNTGKVGTVFGGEAQLNLTLAEILRKQKQF